MESENMRFVPLDETFREMLLQWFEEEHVKIFYYGDGLQNTLRNIELYCQGINNNGDYSFDHWIAFYGDKPFGFLMTSHIDGPYNEKEDYNKWYVEGKETFTLDLLIGPQEFLGKGLASKMIQSFIIDQFSHAAFFLIDPAKSNHKAVHVYEKAGFSPVEEFYPSFDPTVLHVMMRMSVDDLKK